MSDKFRHRKSDRLCSLEEIKGSCIISQVVYPGANQIDLFGAEIKMRIDHCVSAVDKEAKLTEAAAVADEFINVCMCLRVSCALECKICKMSALSLFNCCCKSFHTLIIHKVYSCVCAHSLSKLKTLLISVYCADVFNTHGTENGNADQTDRSAALNNNSAVELQNSCCFCSLNCVNKNCTWLYQNTGIQIQITYIKESRTEISASD